VAVDPLFERIRLDEVLEQVVSGLGDFAVDLDLPGATLKFFEFCLGPSPAPPANS